MIDLEPLNAAISYAEENPKLYNQERWFSQNECGTAACLAGILTIQAGWKPLYINGRESAYVAKPGRYGVQYVQQVAIEILTGRALGDSGGVDNKLIYQMFDSKQTLEGIKKIRDMIATGEAYLPEDPK